MNVYLMSAVKLNLVKFYYATRTQIPQSSSACSAIQLLVDTYLKDILDKMCINSVRLKILMHTLPRLRKLIACEH